MVHYFCTCKLYHNSLRCIPPSYHWYTNALHVHPTPLSYSEIHFKAKFINQILTKNVALCITHKKIPEIHQPKSLLANITKTSTHSDNKSWQIPWFKYHFAWRNLNLTFRVTLGTWFTAYLNDSGRSWTRISRQGSCERDFLFFNAMFLIS